MVVGVGTTTSHVLKESKDQGPRSGESGSTKVKFGVQVRVGGRDTGERGERGPAESAGTSVDGDETKTRDTRRKGVIVQGGAGAVQGGATKIKIYLVYYFERVTFTR